jgi:limonene-1,2-epoxide hydrolase
MVLDMLGAWGEGKHEPDVDRIVDCFAPDGVWTLYMPDGPSIRGKDAIRTEIERQLQYVGGFMCQILNIASNDHVVITERQDSFIRNGKPLKQYIAGVFELNSDGLIASYRDYFDLKDFVQHTGANIQAISGLEGPGAADRPVPEATASGLSIPPPPAATPEQKFIADFCAAWGDGSLERKPDVERIVAMMAPEAEWQLWVPGGPTVKGRQALREEIQRQIQYATNNKCNIVHSVSTKTVVLQERSDWAVLVGRPCPHQMVAVYDLDSDGLIVGWREYINMADLDRKRGVAVEQAHVVA